MTDSLIDDRWSRVWNLKLTKLSQLAFPLTAWQIRSAVSPCEMLYTGGFQTQQCHLINTIRHKRLTILDGGACIHSVPDLLRVGSRGKRFHALVPGMYPHIAPGTEAAYFTSYDIGVSPEQFIHNDYRILRARMQAELPRRDEIVFISQPLERDLNVSVDTDQVIAAAMEYHGAKQFRYILHPREKQEPPGSERLPHLIELFGLTQGYLPKAFVTYMSSAARSLQLIYGIPVTCYDIMPCLPESAGEVTRTELRKVYDDFRASGMDVLDLPANAASAAVAARRRSGLSEAA